MEPVKTPVRHRTLVAMCTAMVVAAGPPGCSRLPAQDVGEVTFSGQIRPRTELRDASSGNTDFFTSMRVRGTVAATLEQGVRAFLQIQDVRIWGEELNTLTDFNADNMDIHQGYIEFHPVPWLRARVGRQEISIADERLIGAVEWTQQARAFDGARLTASVKDAKVDLFGTVLADRTASVIEDNAYLAGAIVQLAGVGPGRLGVSGLFNGTEAPVETHQATLGARWSGILRSFHFRGEGAFQTGKRLGADVTAFMFSGEIGSSLFYGKGRLTLWYDYLSGDDDPTDDEIKVFDTLFATNHKFYGLADLFLNIPVQTGGRGLQDLAVKAAYAPRADLSLAMDIHTFRLSKDVGLTTGHLGEEADLSVRYRYTGQLTLSAGFSQFLSADGLGQIGRPDKDDSWFYVMTDVQF